MRPTGSVPKGREADMTMFMSTVTSKIDAKGRVSVPSVFRSAIILQNGASQNGDVTAPHGIFVYPSFKNDLLRVGVGLARVSRRDFYHSRR